MNKICFFNSLLLFIATVTFALRGPQDAWYLDREIEISELPGFYHPRGIDIVPNGITFIADTNNHGISLIDQNGTFLKRWGVQGSGDGELNSPYDLEVTPNEVYVVDQSNHRIQVFDHNGTFKRKWGSYGTANGQFRTPKAIAIDYNGSSVSEVFVADWDNHKVQIFDENGTFKRSIGSYGSANEQIQYASGVEIGPDNLVYISSRNQQKIKVFEHNGTYVRSFNTNGYPWHLAFHGDNIAVSMYDHHKSQVFDKNGTLLTTIGTSASTETGKFYHNLGIAYDSSGELHISCSQNHRVQIFDSNGTFKRTYGYLGIKNFNPYDIDYTPENTFLITDIQNHRAFEVDENGSFLKMIASSGNGDGLVNAPRSIHLATNNKIYVSDSGRHRIQVFDRNGTFIKKFGQSGSGNGEFNQPYGITSTNNGDIYVVDRYNHRVQVFDGNGTFIRKFGSYGSLEGQINQPIDIAVTAANQIAVLDYINRRVVYFSASGQFVKHHSTHSHEEFIGKLPNGLIATTRSNIFNLYDANGNRIKNWNKSGSTSSAFTSLPNGSIAWVNYNTDKINFYRPTFRTIRPKVSKEIPFPEVISVAQQQGTNLLDVTFRINDLDSTHVHAAMLGFVDGGNDLSKVIVPQTFVGSTVGKLDANVTTNQVHTVTWNAGADWNVGFGELEMAILAKDDRNLLNIHFLTLPASDGNSSTLQISRSPLSDSDLLNLWYWLLATNDQQISRQGGSISAVVTGNAPSFQPSDLSNLVLWLDANDVDGNASTFYEQNGTVIDKWVNLADSDHNFTQSNTSKKPTLHRNVLNGKPGIFFDNSDDGMASTLNINARPYSVFILFNCLDNVSRARRAIQGSHNWLIGPYSNKIGYHPNDGWASHSNSFTAGNFYFASAITTDQGSTFMVNGADVTTNSNANNKPGYLHLGGSGSSSGEVLNGYICEVIGLNREVTNSELTQLQTYVAHKWNISTTYVDNTSTSPVGRTFLLNKMNLREATSSEVTRAKEGAVPGMTNQFTPTFKVGPNERPVKVNEYGFDTATSNGFWVVPN